MAYQPKNYRKFVAGAVTTALVASAVAPVAGAEGKEFKYTDDDQLGSAKEAIYAAYELGLIQGAPNPDGTRTFNPLGEITRGQVVKVLARYVGDVDTAGVEQFSDLADNKDAELLEAALKVKAAKVFTGKENGTVLEPDSPITRQQMAKVVVNAFDLKNKEGQGVTVTDLDNAYSEYREYIEILAQNGVTTVSTYNPLNNVTRAQFASFTVRTVDAVEKEETELAIESVSAINNTTFEVSATFAQEVTAADLTGKKLTLTNGSTVVTATFKQLDGQTGVFVVDNKGTLQPGNGSVDGTYKVTSTDFTVAAETVTSYNESLAGNQVKGFVYDISATTPKALANAIVEINGRTVATDAYGFYSIPSNAGSREVTVTAPGYTYDEATVVVSRNDVTVQNFEVTKLDVTKLEINGKAVDAANDAAIENATVNLYEKATDGSWTKVATTTSAPTTGAFTFGNTAATIPTTFVAGAIDEIETGKEYKVEIVKALTAANLNEVFHTKEVVVKASTSKEKNELGLVKSTKVKEIENFTIDLAWAADAVLPTASTKVQVDLITADGKTVLEAEEIAGSALSLSTDSKGLTQPYNLVAKSYFQNGAEGSEASPVVSVKPRLTSGQYFLRINDGSNAYSVVPVTVTEGASVVAQKAEIKKAQSTSVTATIGSIQYAQGLMAAPNVTAPTTFSLSDYLPQGNLTVITGVGDGTATAARSGNVSTTYTLTQNVAGVDVELYSSSPSDIKVDPTGATSLSGIKVTGIAEFAKLAAGTSYKATPTAGYVNGTATTVSATDAAAQTLNVSLTSAAALNSIDLTDAGTTLPTGALTVNNIKVVNEAGTVVAETGKITGITTAQLKDHSTASADQQVALNKLEGLKPGKYKVVIDINGYKVKETAFQTYYDFQSVVVTEKTAFEAIPGTTITGFIRAEGTTNTVADIDAAAEASIIVLNAAGKVVAAQDFGTTTTAADETYTITSPALTAGKYKVIVRGEGFETSVQEINVEANKANTLNFYVVDGGEGLVKLAVRDSKNAAVNGNVTLTDVNYIDFSVTSNIATGVSVTAPTFGGLLTSSISTVEWASSTALPVNGLSAGSYNLLITGTGIHNYAETITLADVNDTFYKAITVSNTVSGAEVPLTVNFTGSADVDYIVVKDQNGNIVKVHRETGADVATAGATSQTVGVAANGTYTVEAYSNGRFVGSSVVTVQDFAKSVSIANDPANR